jgi:hypothetical protein
MSDFSEPDLWGMIGMTMAGATMVVRKTRMIKKECMGETPVRRTSRTE